MKHNIQFFVEYFAMDLIMDKDGSCRGITALCMEDGTIHRFQVRCVCAAQHRLAMCRSSPRV